MARSDFIKEIAPDAQKIYKKYDILASLIIAQACLESAWGTSGLAQKGKNLFGIKGTYNGQYVLMWTTEYDRKGNATRVQAKFRKYPSWYASLQDLAKLYVNGTSWDPNHYKAVVGEKDYKKATAALVKAGYATDPNYATKLNGLIETYNLTQYDSADGVPDDPDEPETPISEPDFPSKEYDGKDIPLNKNLPSDVDFPQLHVSTKDGKDVVEITGVIPDLTDDTSGKKSFTFTITKTQENAIEFDLLVNDNILYLDEKKFNHQKYYITNVDVRQENNVLKKTVTASHIFSVLLINNYVNETVSKKMTIKEAFDLALKDTPFKYELKAPVNEFQAMEQENFGDGNSTELIDKIVSDYGPELDVDNYKILVYKKMGRKINFTLDSRYNMPGISIKVNSQNSTTRAWGYGATKKNSTDSKNPQYEFEPILYVHPEEDKFLLEGLPRWADPIKDETIKKASSMVSALKKHVNPYPEMTVEADFQKIYEPKLLKIEQDFWKGDTIHILADTAAGITFEDDVRLVSIQYNPLNPYSSPKLTFANFRKDIQDVAVNQAKQLKDQKRYIDQLFKTLG
ncbi:alkaline phosphatase [Bacillus glycinifermentans]|uniref:Alkaline phosphatase n=2 Tax=Bacillus glycinifermentans TaxID=1664069 RepID=A0A0J6E9S1_9BACI|nr:phage tail spike protein [Bacillus glycinifermentans]ATH95180.1 alkaline phosphatase [Bacillus glycinifermentans]KMM60397.1 alkaline phosphatase [Bacillus glycinifermentans]KRT92677.1 alkaline phosphatase [Bacillus glycinifermentans]MEC0497291.1 phage tail spike protein [Bacillus glycinifermentans]MEC0543504.1 phage tail spike protein [Bacillus glycinifermentans]